MAPVVGGATGKGTASADGTDRFDRWSLHACHGQAHCSNRHCLCTRTRCPAHSHPPAGVSAGGRGSSSQSSAGWPGRDALFLDELNSACAIMETRQMGHRRLRTKMHGPKRIVLSVFVTLLLINSVEPLSARERRLKNGGLNVLLSPCSNLPTISFFMLVLFVDAVISLSLRNFLFVRLLRS
jgi:hypothetical protein